MPLLPRRRSRAASPLKPRPPAPPALSAGDHVRIKRVPGTMPAHQHLEGATGVVERVAGDRVVLRLDDPYEVNGLTQQRFYSYARELDLLRVVGRMGTRDLYAVDGDQAAE
jgi:hypothetical protein